MRVIVSHLTCSLTWNTVSIMVTPESMVHRVIVSIYGVDIPPPVIII